MLKPDESMGGRGVGVAAASVEVARARVGRSPRRGVPTMNNKYGVKRVLDNDTERAMYPKSCQTFSRRLLLCGGKARLCREVAAILAARFGEAAILYDKFHEAEFARPDLGIYLPKLYGEQSDLIVPVLCPDYDRSAGPAGNGCTSTARSPRPTARVMPCRFDYAMPTVF